MEQITETASTIHERLVSKVIEIPVVLATPKNIADYGIFIGTDVPNAGLTIPFYKGTVEEGHNLPFICHGNAVVRTARIHPRTGPESKKIRWMERHLRMTQLFIGLGDSPFIMVLGKSNHDQKKDLPDPKNMVAFVISPGHGVMIHRGTWHDFPVAMKTPVTVLTMNSEEVVEALASQKEMDEMNNGDVFKIDFEKRTGYTIELKI